MSTELTSSGVPEDANDPAFCHRRISELQADLETARQEEIEARGVSARHQLMTGRADETLLSTLARASAHVSSVEAAVDLARIQRDAAEMYQTRQKALAIAAKAQERADEFKRLTPELEATIELLAQQYSQVFTAGHGITACIGEAKKLIPPQDRKDARVYAGDAREGLSFPAHFCERVQIEIFRHLGRLWPNCPDVSAGRKNTLLHEVHDQLAANALAEVRAYLNLED